MKNAVVPHFAGAMTARTEWQLLQAYSRLLSEQCAPHIYPRSPRIFIDAYDLESVFGEKLAYLAAMRRGFKLSADGRTWSRQMGPETEETVRLFPDEFAAQAKRARLAIDPLGLLAPFTRGQYD